MADQRRQWRMGFHIETKATRSVAEKCPYRSSGWHGCRCVFQEGCRSIQAIRCIVGLLDCCKCTGTRHQVTLISASACRISTGRHSIFPINRNPVTGLQNPLSPTFTHLPRAPSLVFVTWDILISWGLPHHSRRSTPWSARKIPGLFYFFS